MSEYRRKLRAASRWLCRHGYHKWKRLYGEPWSFFGELKRLEIDRSWSAEFYECAWCGTLVTISGRRGTAELASREIRIDWSDFRDRQKALRTDPSTARRA